MRVRHSLSIDGPSEAFEDEKMIKLDLIRKLEEEYLRLAPAKDGKAMHHKPQSAMRTRNDDAPEEDGHNGCIRGARSGRVYEQAAGLGLREAYFLCVTDHGQADPRLQKRYCNSGIMSAE